MQGITALSSERVEKHFVYLVLWALSMTVVVGMLCGTSIYYHGQAVRALKQIPVKILTLQDAGKQLVELRGIEDIMPLGESLFLGFGERVVELLYTIDYQSEEARTTELGRVMTPSECHKLNESFDLNNKHSHFSQMKQQNLIRQVHVTDVSILSNIQWRDNILRVEWRSIDTEQAGRHAPIEKQWVTTISFDISPGDYLYRSSIQSAGYHLVGFTIFQLQTKERQS